LVASILIIIASSAAFLYWFRQTCLLILAQRSQTEYSAKVTSTIRLSFPQTEAALDTESTPSALDRVHEDLENDYRMLTELLGHATGAVSVEHRLLEIDYKAMQFWYKMTRSNGHHSLARKALGEMSSILGCFADELGQDAAA
jgi:hypothetical protein